MSAPVITGFCYAAALTVASTQVKGLFGLKFKGSSFVEIWQGFFTNLSSIHAADAILGWSVIVILLLMRVHNHAPFFIIYIPFFLGAPKPENLCFE